MIMIGIQASGKSTFCERYIPDGYVYISLDDVKTRRREWDLISDCISEGRCLVIDNTNPTKAERSRYIPLLKENGYVVTGCFMQSRIRDCVRRNETRTGKAKVPATAIAATSNKLELPVMSEGFDKLLYIKMKGEDFEIEEWVDENEI